MKAISKAYPKVKLAKQRKLRRKSLSQQLLVCVSGKGSFVKHFSAFLMLFLIILITANSAFNLHTHVLRDGTTITHAHPFKNNPSNNNNNHDHSELEYLHLSFLLTFDFDFDQVSTLIPEVGIADYHCKNGGIYRIFQKRINTNKAPPKTTASFSI